MENSYGWEKFLFGFNMSYIFIKGHCVNVFHESNMQEEYL